MIVVSDSTILIGLVKIGKFIYSKKSFLRFLSLKRFLRK